ncbi:MAG: SCP2 sterol-binding domain-containing protein [Lachnospiraceae bacterium]|nr:SCP2 sterol-binding domain-containing protein [Lachnospiraceae bacterium]
MNINIYYGGRGLIDDPTLLVINKMQEVLEELNVKVERFNLYELKNQITTLPQTLKNADGIILATTVEWYGIGGYMQQFLDACWLYGDKEKIEKTYMCPVVMSTTYGEREGKLHLNTAWEILGGLCCSDICGYITDTTQLEMNQEYINIIEKKAENMYRTINQKMACLPTSNQAVKTIAFNTKHIALTPQESEQLSQYASDDSYVQRQKEDIQELTSMFKGMMEDPGEDDDYAAAFQKAFKPQPGIKAGYKLFVGNKKEPLVLNVNVSELVCSHDDTQPVDVEIHMEKTSLEEILSGRMTFQRAFMSGDMKMKGDFKILRALDQIFMFSK